VVTETEPAKPEVVVATDDHPEIPVESAVPIHHEPVVAAQPELDLTPPIPPAVEQTPTYQAAIAEISGIVRGPEPEVDLLPELALEPLPEPIDEPAPEPAAEPVLEAQPEPVVVFVEEVAQPEEAEIPLAAAFDHLVDAEPAPEPVEPYQEPVADVPAEYTSVEPPAPHWADQMPPLPAEIATPRWHGPAKLASIPVDADQLGLANPIVITLVARLKDSSSVELDASQSGIYRPQTFRAAPWSGFAYDQASDGRTGLAAGTRILTSRGEMEVEKLLPGDTAMTLRAPALVPITWIGKSVATAAPILIDAGALGPNLPRRALCLAPDQPVYVEPIPVPAARLVNGTTIRVVDTEDVDLFHVDVGRAEILFAEGLPLSSGDRARLQRA
jgi:hypothetical protein